MTLTESDTHMFKLLREYIEQRNALRLKELEELDDDGCEHSRRDEDGWTPFCVDCGLVFEDETQFVNPYGYVGFRRPTAEQEGDEDEQDEDEQDEDEQDEDEDENEDEDEDENEGEDEPKSKPKPKRKPKRKPKPKPKQKPTATPKSASKPEPNPTSVKDLRRIAKERGIKYFSTMSGKTLSMVLGLEISKPDKYIFRNRNTGEEHRFHSIYKASKGMNINPGLVTYYVGREMIIDGDTYEVMEV